MRHGMAGNRLGRNSSLREVTVRDIAKAVLIRQRIKTTEAKAKEARKLVDKLITLGKKGTLAHKRRAFAVLCDHKLVSDLFDKIAVRFSTRQGGYTRIIKLATTRKGDNAKVVFLELTEKEKAPLTDRKKVKKASASKKKAVEDAELVSDKKTAPSADVAPKAVTKKTEIKEQKRPPERKGALQKMFRRKSGAE